MVYQTKSYQIDTPGELWKAFGQLHADRDRINSRIVELIAEDVERHASGDLDPRVREEITRIIGGEN